MAVAAIVALVRANPVETIEVFLYRLDKMVASDDGVRNLADFATRVRVDVDICLLSLLHCHVVTVLALLALLAHTSFEVWTQCVFVIDRFFG